MSFSTEAWQKIATSRKQLNLDLVLACGQSFRWAKTNDGCWLGTISDAAYLLKQNEDGIMYKILGEHKRLRPCRQRHQEHTNRVECRPVWKETLGDQQCNTKKERKLTKAETSNSQNKNKCSEDNDDISKIDKDLMWCEANLKTYFQLDIDLIKLYDQWKEIDENFKSICKDFEGVRMLRQDPVENLFSFICSQNNNISRITSLVLKLCSNFGTKICEYDGQTLYTFPSLRTLAGDNVEETLRHLGFGYRAKFISQSAQFILKNHSEAWLYNLRKESYKEAHAALCQLPGVGAKVADCVSLMSLDKTEAVPVDTHVWQIACKAYLPHLRKYKSITDKVYKEVGDYFRALFGSHAGWAHSVLFSADLKRFQHLLTPMLKEDEEEKHNKGSMDRVTPQEKSKRVKRRRREKSETDTNEKGKCKKSKAK